MAKDHPRLRGEYRDEIRRFLGQEGSPPLARGILMQCWGSQWEEGITPACAGNTRRWWGIDNTIWDHPRLRGEYFLAFSALGRS